MVVSVALGSLNYEQDSEVCIMASIFPMLDAASPQYRCGTQ